MGALTTAAQASEIAFGFMGSKALFAALEHGVSSALADARWRPGIRLRAVISMPNARALAG